MEVVNGVDIVVQMGSSIKQQFLILIWFIVIIVAAIFAYSQYHYQVGEYLDGVDRRLYTAARMAKSILPENYHDQIVDRHSVSNEQYLELVDKYNALCDELGLQYLWSNLLVDNQRIVFTSSTSTSKNVEKGDHALFFEEHTDPHAFDSVLSKLQPTYSSFTNEWGQGRMVLLPYKDKQGRVYVFGASISLAELEHKVLVAGFTAFFIFIVAFVFSTVLGLFLSSRITRDIRLLSITTDRIARGDYGEQIDVSHNSEELVTLAKSINAMSESIKKHDLRLSNLVEERTRELSSSERKIRTILESCEDAIITTDENGIVDAFNPAASILFGYQYHEIRGKSIPLLESVNSVRDIEILQQSLSRSLEGSTYQVFGLKKDGGKIPLKIKLSKVVTANNPALFVWVLEDVSNQLKHEEDLKNAMEAADAANKAKTDFLTAMSHELRTPLNSIIGFAQVAELRGVTELSPELKRYNKFIRTGGEHLLRLINNILDLARIESGREEIEIRPIKYFPILQTCCSIVESQAKDKNVSVRLMEDHDFNGVVMADETRLRQVILNLLSNAVKYNQNGGEVVIATQVLEQTLQISISDTGKGIAPQNYDDVFKPFERLGSEYSGVEGSGVGMTICKKLIELMSGKIGFDSRVGEGSCFWVQLPLFEGLLGDVSRNETRLASIEQQLKQRVFGRVLYIEDIESNVILMQSIVGSLSGVELLSAKTGDQGIQLAKMQQPDLIILDIQLPDMSGFEVLTRLKAIQETSHIPIVALTADAMNESKEKGLSAGFQRYLTKPVEVTILFEVFAKYLKNQEAGKRNIG